MFDYEDWYYNYHKKMKRFWLCYVEGTNGGRHHRHYLLDKAETEAERLAKLNPDKAVYLLQCVGKCRIELSPVIWEIPRGRYVSKTE